MRKKNITEYHAFGHAASQSLMLNFSLVVIQVFSAHLRSDRACYGFFVFVVVVLFREEAASGFFFIFSSSALKNQCNLHISFVYR